MPSALLPALNGRNLTVDVALNQPSVIRNRIAALADSQIILDKLFSPYGARVQGGGLLYSVVNAANFYTARDVEQRGPGDEYPITAGLDPTPKLALVEDWGGRFQVTDEQRIRNDISYIDQQTTQLANTIARKLDQRAMTVLAAAVTGENIVPGHDWGDIVTIGPEGSLTPSAELPTADLSAAQLASDLQELGVTHDLLILHPQEAHALRTAYADRLAAMLESAGLELFTNPRVAAGTAWVVAKGQVGTVGFETPLTVEVYDDRAHRSRWVQAYAVPAFAVERPYAAKKLTGLAA